MKDGARIRGCNARIPVPLPACCSGADGRTGGDGSTGFAKVRETGAGFADGAVAYKYKVDLTLCLRGAMELRGEGDGDDIEMSVGDSPAMATVGLEVGVNFIASGLKWKTVFPESGVLD